MPIHGGFAYAIQIRQQVFNNSILLAYHAGTIKRSLFLPDLPDGPPIVGMDFSLDPPTITFDPGNHTQLILTISGRGGLTIEFSPGIPESRLIEFQIVALVEPRFAVSPGALNFAPNPDDVTVSEWSFSIVAGSPFSPNANAYLTDAVFRSRLGTTLSQGLTSGFLKIPPIRFGALGPAFDVASTSSVSRVADDSVLIGLNLQNSSVSIVGQIQEVPSFAGSHDIAIALNPAVLPVIFADALTEMKTIIQQQGATGDPPTIITGDQKISVAGSASNDFGSVNFSFDAAVSLTAFRGGKLFQYTGRPVSVKTKIWPAINFLIQNIKVDVDPALWVRAVEVGGVFLFGSVAPLFIEDLLNQVSNQVTSCGPKRASHFLHSAGSTPCSHQGRRALGEVANQRFQYSVRCHLCRN